MQKNFFEGANFSTQCNTAVTILADLLLTKAQFSRLSLKLSTNCHIQERSLEDVNIYRKLYYMKRYCVYIQINS